MMTKEQVTAWVFGCLSGIYRPLPKERIWEWAERTLKIPRGGENLRMQGQPWTSAWSPYVREVMDWFRLPGKQELIICKSSQVGFTMAILIVICWHIVHKAVNIGYYIDSEKEVKNISKVRLKRWITDNNLLEGVNENEDDLSNFVYYLKSMTVYLMGAYSEGAYRNKALGIVIMDELDAHPPVDQQGTSADNARSRLKADPNSKFIAFSTPKTESDQTWQEYLTGTREKFFVPCPCCGHFQPLVTKRLRFRGQEFEDLAGELILDRVRESTWYECEMGCRIEHAQKFEMMQKGEWRASNPNAKPNKRSMQISDLYSNFITWGDFAIDYLESLTNLEKRKTFKQQREGLPFIEEGGKVGERDVLACRDQAFTRGVCPIQPVLLSLVVDVQERTFKYGVLAYSSKGDILPVQWGEVVTWDVIDEIIATPIPSPFGDLMIECGFVDEGDGERTAEVRRFTDKYEHIFPVKGRGETQIQKSIWPSTVQEGDTMVLTYHINDPMYKFEIVYNRIRDGKKRRRWGHRRLILPKDVDPEFVAELLNEKRIEVPNKYRQIEKKWKKTGTNDYLDVLKYGAALWDLMEGPLRESGRLTLEAPPPEPEDEEAVAA